MADNTGCDTDDVTEEWSDKMCIQISLEDKFTSIVNDLTVQKGIINRFLNFYLSGKVQKGLNVRDIIFAVIAIVPLSLESEDFIWTKTQYSDDGKLFYLTPEDKLKTEISNIFTQRQKQNDNQQQLYNNMPCNDPKLSVYDLNVENKEFIFINNEKSSDGSFDPDEPENQGNDQENVQDKTSPKNENNHTKSHNKMMSSELDTLRWFSKKTFDNKTSTIEAKEYGAAENVAFCISCNKLLKEWDSDVTARIHLKYFFGFAALSLLRIVAKSYPYVIKMFRTTFPKTIEFSNEHIIYSPPSNACVTKSYKTFRILDRKTQIMLAKLVIKSYYLSNRNVVPRDVNTGGVKNILKLTLLSPLSDHGLQIISMLQVISSQTACFSSIFESLCTDETSASWTRVHNFFKKYMYQSAQEATFHWARVIDRKQFEYLSCKNNYELAVALAVIVAKLTSNEGIWNAKWVKCGNNLETYKELGHQLYCKMILLLSL